MHTQKTRFKALQMIMDVEDLRETIVTKEK
jgi:hypothetical protein